MTPADEWDGSGELRQMAGLLHARDRANGGLPRHEAVRDATTLFVAGLCRDIWPLVVDVGCRRAVEKCELFLTGHSIGCFLTDIFQAHLVSHRGDPPPQTSQEFAVAVAQELEAHDYPDFADAVPAARDFAIEAVRRSPRTPRGADYLRPFNGTDAVLCGRLRCLLGNPFRPAPPFDPAWRTAAARAIAAGVLADRDWSRLPVLADALDDAGCDDAELLAHARGGGPHVFGCRAVAACLGPVP